jgi:hypothetical protein
MFENEFSNTNQFVITHELLSLILWIIEHEDGSMAKMVQKAFASGLKDKIKRNRQMDDQQLLEDAQQAIIDFFGILESHMIDAMHEQSMQRAIQKNLLPAIDQIDSATCGAAMVRRSIEKATRSYTSSHETAKKALYKELLKRWKPKKNQIAN